MTKAPDVKTTDYPSGALSRMDTSVAARLVMASADVAVVISREGIVKDVMLAQEARLPSEFGAWLGKPWLETTAIDSRTKAQALLADAAAGLPGRLREVNHVAASGGATVPIRYSAVKLDDDGRILVIGRDLRAIAALQQQLVQFQQSMEREYARLRAADTRYRVLFQLTAEPILIIDSTSRRVSEVNPAAVALLGMPAHRITGRTLQGLFVDKGGDVLQELLATALTGSQTHSATLTLADAGLPVKAHASLFRQEGAAYFLIRLGEEGQRGRSRDQAADEALDGIIERLPDAFVVTDRDGAIRTANSAFLDMAGLVSLQSAVGKGLDLWLGRTGVDFGVLKASVRDGGVLRSFNTVLRNAYGAVEAVDICAVSSGSGMDASFGFIIRPAARSGANPAGPSALPRTAEEFRQLVGRVPLKELVRETSDIIEKLCIEAALELTGDNRASAAEMLGLSRQGLYAKLHRFGIGDLSGSDTG